MCINYHCIDIIPQLIPSLYIPEVHIIAMITNPTTNRKFDCHRRDIFAQPQFKEDSHQIYLHILWRSVHSWRYFVMECCNLLFCVPSFTTDTLSTPDPVTDFLNSPNDLLTLHRNILELHLAQRTNSPQICLLSQRKFFLRPFELKVDEKCYGSCPRSCNSCESFPRN